MPKTSQNIVQISATDFLPMPSICSMSAWLSFDNCFNFSPLFLIVVRSRFGSGNLSISALCNFGAVFFTYGISFFCFHFYFALAGFAYLYCENTNSYPEPLKAFLA